MSIATEVTFEKDLLDELTKKLGGAGITIPAGASASKLAILYSQHLQKRIPIQPRKVVESQEFQSRIVPDNLKPGLEDIRAAVTSGKDLSPYLSRKWKDWQRPDFLHLEWGVHHMHLGGPTLEADGFIKREGPLLFVFVTNDIFYIVDILDHNSFSAQVIFDIISRNWPDLMKDTRLQGAVGLAQNISDADRSKLRKANVNVLTEGPSGGVFLGPNMGQTTAGHSVSATLVAQKLIRTVRHLQKACAKKAPSLLAEINRNRGVPLTGLKLRLTFGSQDELEVWETQSNTRIPIEDLS